MSYSEMKLEVVPVVSSKPIKNTDAELVNLERKLERFATQLEQGNNNNNITHYL